MPARGQHGSKVPASRKAAQLYLDEGLEIGALCDRFGIRRTSLYQAVHRLREERGDPLPGR